MFRTYAERLTFEPRDGTRVLAQGGAGIYTPQGQFQLTVRSLTPEGEGALAARRAAALERLREEGLLEEDRKRPLPPYPRKIAVMTSPQGAVIHDIMNVARRRNPAIEIVMIPIPVQGADAAERIVEALSCFSEQWADILILARGGGSAEDLAAFDDESLARALAACPVPVISAIGHEADISVCDCVADLRAGTPSIAAEQAFPLLLDWLSLIEDHKACMDSLLRQKLDTLAQKADRAGEALAAAHPQARVRAGFERLGLHSISLREAIQARMEAARNKLALAAARMEQVSPLAPLARGYALVTAGDTSVRSAKQLELGALAEVRFASDAATVTVVEHKVI